MLGTTFYHNTLRKLVISFGTIFNNVSIERKNSSGVTQKTIKVPLGYGPKQKFLVRIDQIGSIKDGRKVQMILPHMGFEIADISYAPSRHLNTVQRHIYTNRDTTSTVKYQYQRVPYDINFSLYVMAKNMDDSMQIVEQILPFFTPEFTITVNDMLELNQKTDVPIILTSVSNEDTYDGSFTERRAIIWTLNFTCKAYLYSPTKTSDIIRKVIADIYTSTNQVLAKREERLTVEPEPLTAGPDDFYDYTETWEFFDDAKEMDRTTGVDDIDLSSSSSSRSSSSELSSSSSSSGTTGNSSSSSPSSESSSSQSFSSSSSST